MRGRRMKKIIHGYVTRSRRRLIRRSTFSRTDSGRLNVFSLINLEINSRSRFTPRQQSNLNCAGSGRWDAHKLRTTRWHGNYIEESFLQQDEDVSYPEKTLRRIDVFCARRCDNCDNTCEAARRPSFWLLFSPIVVSSMTEMTFTEFTNFILKMRKYLKENITYNMCTF